MGEELQEAEGQLETKLREQLEESTAEAATRLTELEATHDELVSTFDDRISTRTDELVQEAKGIEQRLNTVSYTHLDVYKRQVKDHRTGETVGDADGVLDGAIDPFLEAWLKGRIAAPGSDSDADSL